MNQTKIKNLIRKYHVPPNVLGHMVKVTALSLYLGGAIKKKGYMVRLGMLRWAGLLHDILKICDFKKKDESGCGRVLLKAEKVTLKRIREQFAGMDHVTAGYELLKSMDEAEIAVIIQKHRFSSVIHEKVEERPSTWEEKILYYADKRVMHDKIVTLRERLADLNKRYGRSNLSRKTAENIRAIHELEKEICRAAGISPLQITDRLIVSGEEFQSVRKYVR